VSSRFGDTDQWQSQALSVVDADVTLILITAHVFQQDIQYFLAHCRETTWLQQGR